MSRFKDFTLTFKDIDLAGGFSIYCAVEKRKNEYIIFIRDGRSQDNAEYHILKIHEKEMEKIIVDIGNDPDGYISEHLEETIGNWISDQPYEVIEQYQLFFWIQKN